MVTSISSCAWKIVWLREQADPHCGAWRRHHGQFGRALSRTRRRARDVVRRESGAVRRRQSVERGEDPPRLPVCGQSFHRIAASCRTLPRRAPAASCRWPNPLTLTRRRRSRWNSSRGSFSVRSLAARCFAGQPLLPAAARPLGANRSDQGQSRFRPHVPALCPIGRAGDPRRGPARFEPHRPGTVKSLSTRSRSNRGAHRLRRSGCALPDRSSPPLRSRTCRTAASCSRRGRVPAAP